MEGTLQLPVIKKQLIGRFSIGQIHGKIFLCVKPHSANNVYMKIRQEDGPHVTLTFSMYLPGWMSVISIHWQSISALYVS